MSTERTRTEVMDDWAAMASSWRRPMMVPASSLPPPGTSTSLRSTLTGSASTRPKSRLRRLRMGGSPALPRTARTMPRSVPQSGEATMTSCDTSTRRRVRYPESAVRRAVSARPLRAPWVEMKYSSTVRPSRKLARMGCGMMSPRGLDTRPRMPAIWLTWVMLPRAPERTIMSMGLNFSLLRTSSIDSLTRPVASVQISMSSWRRSSSVMTPRR